MATPTCKYKNVIQKLLHQGNTDIEQTVIDIRNWYVEAGRNEFIESFKHETKQSLAQQNRSDGALIEQAYPKTINEYNKKTCSQNYYISNALIALHELDRMFPSAMPIPKGEPKIFYLSIFNLVKKIFLDSLVLLEDWASHTQNISNIFGVGKNRIEPEMAIYQSAMQVIYGNYSPLSFSDNQSDTSINQLRMSIEIRLRRGFGVIGKIDENSAFAPTPLSEIISAIKSEKPNIYFSVPFEHIERLYGWANIYMHSGLKQYTWSPIYALHYLRPFVIGGQHSKGYSVHAGIRAKQGVVKRVQSKVESQIDKTRYRLSFLDIEDCSIIFE